MKLLILMHQYYPCGSPRIFRWSSIAEYWAKNGIHSVTIITENSENLSACELINGVMVHRFTPGNLSVIKAKLHTSLGTDKKTMPPKSASDLQKPSFKRCVLSVLKNVYHFVLAQFFWPDFAYQWIPEGVSYTENLLVKEKFDCMITVGLPFSIQWAGKKINNKHPDMPWVVDTGDPFCFNDPGKINNLLFYRQKNIRSEHEVISKADAFSVTTEGTRDIYESFFPEWKEKLVVIPPLISIAEKKSDSRKKFWKEDGKIHMCFAGYLYAHYREPDGILTLIREIIRLDPSFRDRFCVHFFGQYSCLENFSRFKDIEDMYRIESSIPSSEVLALYQNADVLLNIGNSASHQLPSKIVEYIYSQKRILNTCTIKEDSVRGYLAGFDWVRHFDVFRKYTDGEILGFRDFLLDSTIKADTEKTKAFVARHCCATIAENYDSVLRSVVSKKMKTK